MAFAMSRRAKLDGYIDRAQADLSLCKNSDTAQAKQLRALLDLYHDLSATITRHVRAWQRNERQPAEIVVEGVDTELVPAE